MTKEAARASPSLRSSFLPLSQSYQGKRKDSDIHEAAVIFLGCGARDLIYEPAEPRLSSAKMIQKAQNASAVHTRMPMQCQECRKCKDM